MKRAWVCIPLRCASKSCTPARFTVLHTLQQWTKCKDLGKRGVEGVGGCWEVVGAWEWLGWRGLLPALLLSMTDLHSTSHPGTLGCFLAVSLALLSTLVEFWGFGWFAKLFSVQQQSKVGSCQTTCYASLIHLTPPWMMMTAIESMNNLMNSTITSNHFHWN